jgi:hypothetical protein
VWLSAILGALYAMRILRGAPQLLGRIQLRRSALIVPLALLFATATILAGCNSSGSSASTGSTVTPAGSTNLTIIATSGSFEQTATFTFTVQ